MSKMNLPIGFAKYRSDDGRERSDIFDCDDNLIASFVDPDQAAQIVRAVNSHEALVEALDKIRWRRPLGRNASKYAIAVENIAEAALAAARGEL